ncbi:MAG: hypothetical protein ACRDLM_02775 [Gaiellaceae bacterium]
MGRLLPFLAVALVVAACAQAGAARTTRTSSCAVGGAPAWAPDGTQIAWGGRKVICIEQAHGSKLRHFDATPDITDAIAWPRRHELLFWSNFRLYKVNPATGRRKNLGDVSGGANNGFAFSVDERGDLAALGCTGDPHSAEPLTVMSLATGTRTSIGGTTFDNCDPSLSPDGRRVVFDRDSGSDGEWETPAGLWTAWTDGSHVAQLSSDGATPVWSPTGEEIAYAVRVGGAPAWNQIRVIPSGGGVSTVLVAKGVQRIAANSWSPNGKLFAFENPRGGVSIVNKATKTVRALHTRATVLDFAWSPDSRQLLVSDVAYNPSCSALWRIPVNGRKPARVTGSPSDRRRC